MLRFIFLFYIILNFLSPVQAQGSKNMGNPLGLYFGGDGSNFGYYFFKPDSSFIFFKMGVIPNNKAKEFKDRFNDTLMGYGRGRWVIENDLFVIKFQSLQDENLLNSNLQYNTSTKAPYDSLFMKVNVTNYDERTQNIASVTLSNRFIANPLGGISQVTLPLNYNKYKLKIYKHGYIEQEIQLVPGYNVHEIIITLSPNDGSTVEVVSESMSGYKFHYENGELIFNGRLKKQREGKEKLALIIKDSYKKYSQQKVFLQKIMKELD